MHNDIRYWEEEFRQKFPDFGNAIAFIKWVEDAAMNCCDNGKFSESHECQKQDSSNPLTSMEKNIPTLRERVEKALCDAGCDEFNAKYPLYRLTHFSRCPAYTGTIEGIERTERILSLMSEVAEDCVRAVEKTQHCDNCTASWDATLCIGNGDERMEDKFCQCHSFLDAVRECANKYKAL